MLKSLSKNKYRPYVNSRNGKSTSKGNNQNKNSRILEQKLLSTGNIKRDSLVEAKMKGTPKKYGGSREGKGNMRENQTTLKKMMISKSKKNDVTGVSQFALPDISQVLEKTSELFSRNLVAEPEKRIQKMKNKFEEDDSKMANLRENANSHVIEQVQFAEKNWILKLKEEFERKDKIIQQSYNQIKGLKTYSSQIEEKYKKQLTSIRKQLKEQHEKRKILEKNAQLMKNRFTSDKKAQESMILKSSIPQQVDQQINKLEKTNEQLIFQIKTLEKEKEVIRQNSSIILEVIRDEMKKSSIEPQNKSQNSQAKCVEC